jgi:uncharacterized protein YndB with AHSA1/START domain
MNPDLDLTLHCVIRAPRAIVWKAWTDPTYLAQWWTPAPTISRIELLEVRPGGGFVTTMSDDGTEFVPHTDAAFLVVEPEERLVFTNAITSAWRPTTPQPVAITAEMIFAEHPEGTYYRVVVRHGDPAAKALHEQLGFFDGWGAVTEALVTLAEGLTSSQP